MESVAMEYKLYLSSMEDQGVVYDKVTGVGGGAKSVVWNQIKCDMVQ
jgi:sugar (pentulose or hexulose) kinase